MKKTLVVDSGSTKTDWAIISDSHYEVISSQGINPATDDEMLPLIDHHVALVKTLSSVSHIYYYGAGVINLSTASRIESWLRPYCKKEVNIHVFSDLVGACRSVAQNNQGIISILGTGSNSCIYDGKKIISNIPSLGYMLGNEGAGSEIGKAILKSYFYKKMPENVVLEFEKLYPLDKSKVVNALYRDSNPTIFLASFGKFISQTTDKTWSQDIIKPLFQEFIDIRIKSYKDFLSYELYFVGSIAYFCKDILVEMLEKNNLQAVKILQKPIDGLIEYHKINI